MNNQSPVGDRASRVANMSAALVHYFKDGAVRVAETQIAASTDSMATTWEEIRTHIVNSAEGGRP
jgi:hypothetical protein